MADEYKLGTEGDALYRELLDCHKGKSADEIAAFHARLILILMNKIGDAEDIRAAFSAAREG